MAATLVGRRTWSLSRSREGMREYKLVSLVRCTDGENDGPYTALNCPGLPLPGAVWTYGNDSDLWAFCKPDATVNFHKQDDGERHIWWTVEQTFSTNPTVRCQDAQIENPLQEPQKLSGGFVNEFREAMKDYLGRMVTNSSHERLRGQQVEFEYNRPTVRIEQNVAQLQLPLLSEMINTVNGVPMWGLPKRCIKLSNISWTKNHYGQCSVYYTRTFEFDVNFETFDRIVLDEGSKALHGEWDRTDPTVTKWKILPITKYTHFGISSTGITPDKNKPEHFIRITDRRKQPMRCVLNGHGIPASTKTVDLNSDEIIDDATTINPGKVVIRYYKEKNFFLLNVPPTLV